ncbi:unnamed protein product [Adineta steineri]|uniref:Uncharacterized protein n=1 Tax=Adineta steineri TaxID=433720 RepID=A0A815GUE9_9BILA|nr:unnamed protein product [Adineta steineri]
MVDEIIPYCFRPVHYLERPLETSVHPLSQKLSFEQLRLTHTTAEQLLSWSISIDVAQRYQLYLIEPNAAFNEVLYNCTEPWFGPRCQYSFPFGGRRSFNHIVEAAFRQRTAFPDSSEVTVQVPCYVLLECHRNGQSWCLDWREVCNGIVDCFDDAVDEEYCSDMEINKCEKNEYRCHNGLCISSELWEDGEGDADCLDRSDEVLDAFYIKSCFQDPTFRCEEHSCRAHEGTFPCGDGQCVRKFDECYNGRHMLLIDAMTAKGNLTDECWIAMICLTELTEQIHGSSLTCLSHTRVNDGNDDCLGASDEQHECQRAYPPGEVPKRFRCLRDIACLVPSQLCNNNNDCPLHDDEKFCKTHQFNCTNDSTYNRSEIEVVLCGLSEQKNRRRQYFSVHTSSNYPSLGNSVVDENLYWSTERHSIENVSIDRNENNLWPWYCNRGLIMHLRSENDSFDNVCMCPPSYYGHLCQYQNQRISLTLHFGSQCMFTSAYPANICQNNGQYIPADVTTPDSSYTCVCPDQFFAWNSTSNCSLQQCNVNLNNSNNNSCLSSSTPCFDYRTINNSRYCAPGILCSILERCDNTTQTCSSNDSVCVINSCCSSQAVCLPLLATQMCKTGTDTHYLHFRVYHTQLDY